MSVAVRQVAWLHAVPKKVDPERKKAREGSRLSKLKAKGVEPRVPEAPLPYLFDLLMEVGPAASGGFGPSPLSYQELLAWQVATRRTLQPWEVSMLRRLSVEWIAQAQNAEDESCPAPWSGDDLTERERASVADDLRAAMRRMAS